MSQRNWPQVNPEVLEAFVAELNEARAKLAEVEAERDAAAEAARCANIDTANMAERLAEVEALCDRMRAIYKDCPPSWVDAVRAVAAGDDRG